MLFKYFDSFDKDHDGKIQLNTDNQGNTTEFNNQTSESFKPADRS